MKRVLIADDEANVRFLLRVAFELAGFEVAEAANGAAAWELLTSEPPLLLTTDYMMPVMDGGELIDRLRAEPATAALPVILISSSTGAGERIQQVDAFVQKPFDPAEVVVLAERLITGGGA